MIRREPLLDAEQRLFDACCGALGVAASGVHLEPPAVNFWGRTASVPTALAPRVDGLNGAW